MMSEISIKFLQQKIRELQTALFIDESDAVARMATHIVSVEAVDDQGQIWFVIPKPRVFAHGLDSNFFGKLDFFRKGKNFYLKIRGVASVVTEREKMPGLISDDVRQRIAKKQAMVVCVKVQHADYFEPPQAQSQSWLHQGGSQIVNWLFNPQYDRKNPQWIPIPLTQEQ